LSAVDKGGEEKKRRRIEVDVNEYSRRVNEMNELIHKIDSNVGSLMEKVSGMDKSLTEKINGVDKSLTEKIGGIDRRVSDLWKVVVAILAGVLAILGGMIASLLR
jgi:archaellum component FlaC